MPSEESLLEDLKEIQDEFNAKGQYRKANTIILYIKLCTHCKINKSDIKIKIEELEDTLDLCRSDGKVAKKEMYALEKQIKILKELLDE